MAFVQPVTLGASRSRNALASRCVPICDPTAPAPSRSPRIVPRMGLFDAFKKAVSPSPPAASAPSGGVDDEDDALASVVLENSDTANVPASYTRLLQRVNALESEYEAMSDADIQQSIAKLRSSHSHSLGQKVPDDVIASVFAAGREMTFRLLGLRPYDVQILGGFALHFGNIAEMATGEGKTLVASLPVILNALFPVADSPVLVVTINDYLTRRDSPFFAPLYRFFGLSVGLVSAGMQPDDRRETYAKDVVYVTNSELGLYYLRDNLSMQPRDPVLRALGFCVIDEVDSILIDDAKTPLIISSSSAGNGQGDQAQL